MPSPLIRTVALTPHPDTRSDAVRSVGARISRIPGGMLALTYALDGDLARVRLPPARPPRIAERLWEHTCCEAFVGRREAAAYHEFNFAPSGEWSAYAFARYRERGPQPDGYAADLDPEIIVQRTPTKLELNALIHLEKLSPEHAGAALTLALATVIEDQAGGLSYWALAHPPGKPDFHHPDAFALELDEVRD